MPLDLGGIYKNIQPYMIDPACDEYRLGELDEPIRCPSDFFWGVIQRADHVRVGVFARHVCGERHYVSTLKSMVRGSHTPHHSKQ